MTEIAEPPAGALRYRAIEQLDVSFPDRTIELVVMPYEREAAVRIDGRMVRETIARGAFDGIERRPNRIRANRDHDVARTIGRAVALHPSRQEGLVAELRIVRTPLGDETLALADEGCLDASAGYLPFPGGETWSRDRTQMRVTKAWLGHIALTPEPAYEDARVLAVRNQDAELLLREPTPNLDAVREWLIADRLAKLERGTAL